MHPSCGPLLYSAAELELAGRDEHRGGDHGTALHHHTGTLATLAGSGYVGRLTVEMETPRRMPIGEQAAATAAVPARHHTAVKSGAGYKAVVAGVPADLPPTTGDPVHAHGVSALPWRSSTMAVHPCVHGMEGTALVECASRPGKEW